MGRYVNNKRVAVGKASDMGKTTSIDKLIQQTPTESPKLKLEIDLPDSPIQSDPIRPIQQNEKSEEDTTSTRRKPKPSGPGPSATEQSGTSEPDLGDILNLLNQQAAQIESIKVLFTQGDL